MGSWRTFRQPEPAIREFAVHRWLSPTALTRVRGQNIRRRAVADRTWGNAQCGNPYDEIHPSGYRNHSSSPGRRSAAASRLYSGGETRSLRTKFRRASTCRRFHTELSWILFSCVTSRMAPFRGDVFDRETLVCDSSFREVVEGQQVAFPATREDALLPFESTCGGGLAECETRFCRLDCDLVAHSVYRETPAEVSVRVTACVRRSPPSFGEVKHRGSCATRVEQSDLRKDGAPPVCRDSRRMPLTPHSLARRAIVQSARFRSRVRSLDHQVLGVAPVCVETRE